MHNGNSPYFNTGKYGVYIEVAKGMKKKTRRGVQKGEPEGGEVGDGEGVGNKVIVEDPKRAISVILRLGPNSFEFHIVC